MSTIKVNQTEKAVQEDYEEIEDEHEVSAQPIPESSGSSSSTFHETDKMTMLANDGNFLIKVAFITILVVGVLAVISIFTFRFYRDSSNPLNYKESNDKPIRGSTNANCEFSEIRYLTSDETLDFSLATDDDL